MNDIQEIRDRLDVVEAEVSRLSEDAATTRAMAAMADRDVADFRQEKTAQTQLLNALRQTQVEHTRVLAEHGTVLGVLVAGQEGLRGEVGELRGEVGGLRGEVGELRGEVGGLRGDVGGLRGEVGELRAGQEGLRGEVGELRAGQEGLRSDVRDLQTGQLAIMRHLGIAE